MSVRKIELEMIGYLDSKLSQNGLAQHAVETKDARTLFRLAAESCVGITEKSGHNDGKMVQLIQETIGGASGEPWCMALVQTCLAYAEVKTGHTSPVVAAELCSYVWEQTPHEQRVKRVPLPGAIAIWQDAGKISGHTEIVLSCNGKTFPAVGGNTSGSTKINEAPNRDGNACVYTERSMKSTKRRKLLGFLKPF
jgi:hypothetical protein